jgi:hypothetical protein
MNAKGVAAAPASTSEGRISRRDGLKLVAAAMDGIVFAAHVASRDVWRIVTVDAS